MQQPPKIPVSERDWRRTPLAVQTLVIALWERVARLEQVVEHQAARIAALEIGIAACQAALRQQPAPSLLPATSPIPASYESSLLVPGCRPPAT